MESLTSAHLQEIPPNLPGSKTTKKLHTRLWDLDCASRVRLNHGECKEDQWQMGVGSSDG